MAKLFNRQFIQKLRSVRVGRLPARETSGLITRKEFLGVAGCSLQQDRKYSLTRRYTQDVKAAATTVKPGKLEEFLLY